MNNPESTSRGEAYPSNQTSEPMGPFAFLRESLRNLRTVGTVTRSSPALCRGVIDRVDFNTARSLVELGAGDGVITEHILEAMHPEAVLLAFEVSPAFCDQLRAIDDPRLIVIQDSAEHLPRYLTEHHVSDLDAVISAIPFVSLPKSLAYEIVGASRDALRGGAPFCQVHYSLMMRKVYNEIFGNVSTNFVALNVPPAFVLTSYK